MPVSNILLSGDMERSIPTLIMQSGPVAKAVLLVLLFFSVVSWAIMLQKLFRFRSLVLGSRRFWAVYDGPGDLGAALRRCTSAAYAATPLRNLLIAGLREGHGAGATGELPGTVWDRPGGLPGARKDRIERAMERSALAELAVLERHLPFLATTANVSPFLGLFGTVWGVMSAFLAMGVKGSASLSVVGPGIAEALITTVAGLAAAIPAVVAYNHFLGRLRRLSIDLERFRSSLADRLTREGSDADA
ncbi:MAG: MotA/TolQ/ExbB proton channel family protein [Candidatus Eisenbacteria bacterium]